MINYDEILKKIKAKKFLFRDKDGDGLLHSLVKAEEYTIISIEPVKALLSRYPHLISEKNGDGFTAPELLDSYQLHSHISNRPLRQLLYDYMDPDAPYRDKFEKTIQMSFIQQLPKPTPDGENYRIIPSKESDSVLSKPVLLFFSGRGNFALKLINGFGRKMMGTFGFYDSLMPDIQTVSVRYPGNDRDLCNDWIASHQVADKTGAENPAMFYIRPFVTRYMRPLYLDQTGQKRKPGEVAKNMRRLNLIGYSYGSTVIQMMSEYLTEDMLDKGFKEKEIRQIQSQILTLHIAPDLNQLSYKNYFRSYHMLNTQDDVVLEPLRPLLPDLKKEKRLVALMPFAKQKNQRIMLINTLENNGEHAPHHISTYCSLANAAQQISLSWGKAILFNGLSNSVQNEGNKSLIPLPQELEDFPGTKSAKKIVASLPVSLKLYRKRIQEANVRQKQ